MRRLTAYRSKPKTRGHIATWLRKKTAVVAILAFFVVLAVAYSPTVLQVFNLLDDYDVLEAKRDYFFFHMEMVHLFSIARPVAALLTNLPILPVQSPEDFRWLRFFSLLTAGVIGAQMIANCVVRLRAGVLDSVAIALATFLGLAFIYAIVDSTAWTAHLLTTFIAFSAYTILGRSNLQIIPFKMILTRRDYRALSWQLYAYCSKRSVWSACLLYQLALYDYPPFALLLTAFPVIALIFSRAPRDYRMLIASRDMLFIGCNLVLYSLSTALLYLPFVRLFTSKGSGVLSGYENEFVAALYAGHQFKYNFDSVEILKRLDQLMTVSGDLWFLPQSHVHILVGAVFLFALVMANGTVLIRRHGARSRVVEDQPGLVRLRIHSWNSEGAIVFLALFICFVIASSPILASAGGFVAYRTSVAPVALVSIIFVFAVQGSAAMTWKVLGNPSTSAAKIGGAFTALTVGAAFVASFDANYTVMKLGRNEHAYFTEIVRRAIDNKSKAIFLLDSRPWIGAQGYNLSPIYDERGRAVPPRELGCFSSYCRQTGSIVRVIAAQLGLSHTTFEVFTPRGDDPIPGLTCEMLTSSVPSYPLTASEHSVELIKRYRALKPLTCVTVSMAWHDLGLEPKQIHPD